MHNKSRRFTKNQSIFILNLKSSVKSKKDESQNGCFKKAPVSRFALSPYYRRNDADRVWEPDLIIRLPMILGFK